MPKPNLYVDLDSTLIHPLGSDGKYVYVKVRPHVDWFFKNLATVGKVNILTHGVRDHAQSALPLLPTKYINLVIAREDMKPVSDAIESGRKSRPLYPPGPIFDDQEWGGWLSQLKSRTVGIDDPKLWIQVERFDFDAPDRDGLKKAWFEFVKRFQ